jgi:hypothetical protein
VVDAMHAHGHNLRLMRSPFPGWRSSAGRRRVVEGVQRRPLETLRSAKAGGE